MPFNGAGLFNRTFSWAADKAAGLDISSSRMDVDSDDIASNGLSNCVTRDGQGSPSANLPMNGFRLTNLGNAVARSDASTLGQVQDDLLNWTIAGGTSDAITATYTPALTTLNDGQICFLRATAANATTTPTFAPNGLTARTITKLGGTPLGIADIAGSLAEIVLRYNLANTRWELLNPSNISLNTGIATTGDVKLTIKSVADTGWLLFDDGTFGSATSGSSNSNSALNQALFNILFASPFTDATCPMLTSTGSATTRAAQGSAAAAWAANCRMSLPKTLGRALAVAGSGAGLTAYTPGQAVGENNHTLTLTETPAGITSVNASQAITINFGYNVAATPNSIGPVNFATSSANYAPSSIGGWFGLTGATTSNSIGVTSNNTGGGAHNTMQPTSFLNAMVKQ